MKRSSESTCVSRRSSLRFSSSRQRRAEGAGLDLLAQPHALAVRGDVLDLVGDRAAVGLAQVRQRVGQRRARHVRAQDLRGDLAHDLLGQPERLGVERRVALGLGAERVEPRGQVAVRAVRLDQRRGGLDGLQQLLARRRRRPRGRAPPRRGAGARRLTAGARRGGRRAERGAEVGEDLLVEAVLALQVLLDDLQELAGLGALDDAMVVRRRHRHHLLGADRARCADARRDSRSRRWRRSCPGRSSAAGRRRSCRCRPGW